MFFLICIDSQSQYRNNDDPTNTMTTMTTIPPAKYHRLDMANLPPYRLEKMSESELKAAIPFYDIFCPIRYKNIWNDEKEAKRAEDEQKADLARTVTRRTQTKSTKMRRPFCKFCQQRGLPLKDCKTHYTKSGPEFGSKITCPILLQQQCSRCGEIGHTPKYCKSEVWLNTDPREISSHRSPLSIMWFPQSFVTDSYISKWQKPIPPALQKRHEEYEEKYVKTSRIWIEMAGDHKHYTNDFRLVMLIEDEDSWFEKKPRTEYEEMVQDHWELMRQVMWDDTPIRDASFYIVRSMPPTYEEAFGAVKFLESVEAASAAAAADTEEERESADLCERSIRKIISKYIEHQRL